MQGFFRRADLSGESDSDRRTCRRRAGPLIADFPARKAALEEAARTFVLPVGVSGHVLDTADMNQEMLESRLRIVSIFSSSAANAWTCSSVGSIHWPSSTRRPGKTRSQRRATSQLPIRLTRRGVLRSTTCQWLDSTARKQTSTTKLATNSCSRSTTH